MKILVIDGNSILNRAFYGIKLLTTKNGQFTNAIYGFMNILLKLEDSEKPDEIAIAFDLKAPTFRHKMYENYKAHRKGMPEELAAQMPVLKELLDLLGYKQVSLEGYEADDILGTLSAAASGRGGLCMLATGDRDSLQLVGNGVTVLLATTKETLRMDRDAVFEKYGVEPAQLIDVKALMGDPSDNIPGVPGVGEKTALGLIQKFGSLEGVYENLEDPFIKKGARTKLAEGRESADISRKLAKIDCDVPINTEVGAYTKTQPDAAAASALLSQLEMNSILARLGLDSAAPAQLELELPQLDEANTKPLPENWKPGCPVYLSAEGETWAAMEAGGKDIYYSEAPYTNLKALLLDENTEKYVFDAKALHRMIMAEEGTTSGAKNIKFDAKLAAYLLNPSAPGYEIYRLAPEYGIQPKSVCAKFPDAPCMEELYTELAKQLNETGMQNLLDEIELPLAEVLASMELLGMEINTQSLQNFGSELQVELTRQLKSIYETVGYEFNLNSPKQLGEALFDNMGLPHGKKTKTGWSTNAETLEGLRKYSPVIDEILLYRTYSKLNSTYVEGLLKEVKPDGRIHSTFNQTEARTGRLSSNEPNLQNIPVRTELGSRLREFFLAKDGCTLVDADYSQIELRILAHISRDEAMQEAFRSGQDIHKATAARVNGMPLEMVTPQMRSAAKAVNFGIVYGIGAFSLSKDIGVSVKEADAFIKSYLDNFPGVREYMESTVAYGKEHGYVTTLYGRRRPVPELASSNRNIQALGERIALNTPIQGTAADIIKLAMIRVYNRIKSENLDSRLILQVHDELIVEAPEKEAGLVASLLREEMEGSANLDVVLRVDVTTGKTWLDAKG